MKISLLTYNVLFNKAFLELKKIFEDYSPDIVCLQEVDTDPLNLKKMEIMNYKLADYSNTFIKFRKIYGVATYYNSKTIRFLRSDTVTIPRSFYEMLFMLINLVRGGSTKRTILKTEFVNVSTNIRITVNNIHLIDLALNEGRMKHIKYSLKNINVYKKNPLIIAGDFNFLPYSRKKLEKIMDTYKLKEATKSVAYTLYYVEDLALKNYSLVRRLLVKFLGKIFSVDRVKVDYIFYKNLKLTKSETINVDHSDHFPVLSSFKI